jgi:drug/metabolite transporter (DMT)-like permease
VPGPAPAAAGGSGDGVLSTLLGVLGALVAAVSYGVASVLQAVGARRTARGEGLRPGLLVQLGSQLPYVAGLGLDLVGFVASLAALRRLPLFFVQSAIAGSVGVTAVVAVVALGTRLRRRETAALAGLGLGLVLLAVTAQPEAAAPLPGEARWGLLGGVALLVGYGVVLARVAGTAGAHGLAVGAGLGFAAVGIAARTIAVPDPPWGLVGEPLTWAIAGYGFLAILLFGSALQRGSVTTASALTFAVETVVPAAVGITLLGDRPRPGSAPLAVAGFVLTLAGAVLLARFAEPEDPVTGPPR